MITKLGITIIKTRTNIHITDTYCKTARTYYFLKELDPDKSYCIIQNGDKKYEQR